MERTISDLFIWGIIILVLGFVLYLAIKSRKK